MCSLESQNLSQSLHTIYFGTEFTKLRMKQKITPKFEISNLINIAKQKVKENNLNSFIIRIQLCLDAKLAEVISYQGEKPIPYFMGVSKTQSKDEKIQQNRFLTEWLESIFCSGISSEIEFNE